MMSLLKTIRKGCWRVTRNRYGLHLLLLLNLQVRFLWMMCSFLVVSIHIFLSLIKYSNAPNLVAPCVFCFWGILVYKIFFIDKFKSIILKAVHQEIRISKSLQIYRIIWEIYKIGLVDSVPQFAVNKTTQVWFSNSLPKVYFSGLVLKILLDFCISLFLF